MSPQSERILVEDLATVVGTTCLCGTACCKLHNDLGMFWASAKLVPRLLTDEN